MQGDRVRIFYLVFNMQVIFVDKRLFEYEFVTDNTGYSLEILFALPVTVQVHLSAATC